MVLDRREPERAGVERQVAILRGNHRTVELGVVLNVIVQLAVWCGPLTSKPYILSHLPPAPWYISQENRYLLLLELSRKYKIKKSGHGPSVLIEKISI